MQCHCIKGLFGDGNRNRNLNAKFLNCFFTVHVVKKNFSPSEFFFPHVNSNFRTGPNCAVAAAAPPYFPSPCHSHSY